MICYFEAFYSSTYGVGVWKCSKFANPLAPMTPLFGTSKLISPFNSVIVPLA